MKNQLRKAEMIFVVNELLVENVELFSSVFQLNYPLAKFNANTEKLKIHLSVFEKDITWELNNCNLLREKLVNLLIPVTGTLLVFAKDHKNKSLAEKLKELRKKSENMTHDVLLDHSKSLISKVKKHFNWTAQDDKEKPDISEDHISTYGITIEMIEELTETRKQYRKACTLVNHLQLTKKKSKKKITSLIKQNDNLLKYKIDLILSIYEKLQPAFYNAYQNARAKEMVLPSENDSEKEN